MSNFKGYLVGLLLGLLLCGGFFGGLYWGRNSQLKKDQAIQVELENQINSLQNKLESIQKSENNLSYQRDSLELEILKISENLKQLQKKYDKKVSDITNYTNPELEQFFRERYSSD